MPLFSSSALDTDDTFYISDATELRLIYQKAFDKVKNITNNEQIKEILDQYLEMMPEERYTFEQCSHLDKEYFDTDGGGYWRAAYNNPMIGDILTPDGSNDPYIVTKVGIATFNIEQLHLVSRTCSTL